MNVKAEGRGWGGGGGRKRNISERNANIPFGIKSAPSLARVEKKEPSAGSRE